VIFPWYNELINLFIEYAAAFFLLADSLKDAVNVCFNQLNDMQLAIAVARVYEGDNGPVFTELLTSKILPLAAQQGNKWLATWSFWMLGRRADAVRTLIVCVTQCLMFLLRETVFFFEILMIIFSSLGC